MKEIEKKTEGKKQTNQPTNKRQSYLGTLPHHLPGKQPVVEKRIILRQKGRVTEQSAVFDAFLLQVLVLLVFEELQRRTHTAELCLE